MIGFDEVPFLLAIMNLLLYVVFGARVIKSPAAAFESAVVSWAAVETFTVLVGVKPAGNAGGSVIVASGPYPDAAASVGVTGPKTDDQGPVPIAFTAATRIQCGTDDLPEIVVDVDVLTPSLYTENPAVELVVDRDQM